jgi:flagella basal body P-ring formation protein FlgA
VLAVLVLLAWPVLAVAQSEIVLRPSVRVDAGDVLLRDVAEITGAEAIALAETVVLAAGEIKPGSRRPVDADAVRSVLTKANANWSRVNLSGSTCWVIRRAEGRGAAAGGGAKPRVNDVAAADAAAQNTTAAEANDGPTVRTSIPVRLAEFLGVEIDELRLTYDASDAGLLNTPTTGRIVEIAPVGSAERVPMQVSVYSSEPDGMKLIASGTVRVGVQVRREMAVARVLLGRGRAVTEADVVFEERWVKPGERSPTREELIGSSVRGRVQAGAVVSADEVETPYLVRKGQVVSVRTVTSSVVLKSTARALNNAKLGEDVKLQSLSVTSTRDRSGVMTGRVDGPGRVIVGATVLPEVVPDERTEAVSERTQDHGAMGVRARVENKK